MKGLIASCWQRFKIEAMTMSDRQTVRENERVDLLEILNLSIIHTYTYYVLEIHFIAAKLSLPF